jgi:hypothetical protein
MDFKLIDVAIAFARAQAKKNGGELPAWGKYQELVRDHLRDAYDPKPKMPKEYYYAYLRTKGLSDVEARDRMGLDAGAQAAAPKKKSFWKFW